LLEKLHIIIALVSAALVAVIGIIFQVSFFHIAMDMVCVIVVFYLLGLWVRHYLKKNVFTPKEPADGDGKTQDK